MFLVPTIRESGLGDIASENAVFLRLTPAQLLALTAYGEARGEGPEGMAAVLNVIKNRVQLGLKDFYDRYILQRTGDPIPAVVLKRRQFSIFDPGNPNRQILLSIARNFDAALQRYPTLRIAYELANQMLSGALPDNVAGAVYYHPLGLSPGWARRYQAVARVGKHIFYALTG